MNSTREAYGQALISLAKKYSFYVLDADLSKATQTIHFSKAYPDRFINMGIAEANMLGYAAGLSTCSIPVFASTFAAFSAGRGYDQIRNSIAYPNLNVKICATHAGVLIGADGGSHQCIEDISLMRTIPNMTVLCPCDTRETYPCMEAALNHHGPVYIRFGRLGTPEIYDKDDCFKIGRGNVLLDGSDVAVIAIGDMVSKALTAADMLRERGISAAVIDMPSIKPIDHELIKKYAVKTKYIVTAEDHNIIGGLGSAVAEVLSTSSPTLIDYVGVNDRFGQSGDPSALAELYGLTSEAIVEKVLARKTKK